MRSVRATRYLTPLREGGSVPAIVEADDSGTYVVKFRGAAQGPRALIAEIIAGELGRLLGLPVPALVGVEVDPLLARSEPDPEIQATLAASGSDRGPHRDRARARRDPARRGLPWLVAPRSAVIQPSPVHTGLCADPAAALDELFARLVLPVR